MTPSRDDFPNWFSPMLVKELRQGLRSRGFIGSFLLLQILLVIVVTCGVAFSSESGAASALNAFFWMAVGLPLVVLMPLMAFTAVSSERAASTLELVLLTRLTPRRIIIGKWVAVFARCLLLVMAVLPYLVIRHFLGRVNVANDLSTLVTLLEVAAILTALAVSASPFLTRSGRGIVIAIVCIGGFIMLQAASVFGSTFFPSAMGGAGLGWARFIVPLAGQTLLALIAFEFGAAKIAPAGANHSAWKRLLAFLILLPCAVLPISQSDARPYLVLAGVLLVFVIVSALLESVPRIAGAYRPLVRWGVAGRIAGAIFHPGWASGLVFSAALFMWWRFLSLRASIGAPPFYIELAAAIVVPAAFLVSIRKPRRWLLGLYIAWHISSVVLGFIAIAFQENLHVASEILVLPLPTATLLLDVTSQLSGHNLKAVAATWMLVELIVALTVLAVKAIIVYRTQMRPAERAALARLRSPA